MSLVTFKNENSMITFGEVLNKARCKVFIINLDRRPDRWDQISEHLTNLNYHEYIRVPAVDGKLESEELSRKVVRLEDEDLPYAQYPTQRQRGVLGCLKSHLKALIQASQSMKEKDIALILEDDCFFIENAEKILSDALDELPSDWQFLMLGAIYETAPGHVFTKTNLKRVFSANATHAYIVNKGSCNILIQRIQNLLVSGKIFPVDELFKKYQTREKWYAAHPLIAGQRSGNYSDIDGVIRMHTNACFKLGVTITWKVWLWMKIRPIIKREILERMPRRLTSIWKWFFDKNINKENQIKAKGDRLQISAKKN